MQTQTAQTGWDTRAWAIGLIGGTLSGSISAWSTYAPFARRLNNLPHFPIKGAHNADIITAISALVSLLLLPGLTSGIARRWTFFWGLVPLMMLTISVDAEICFESGWHAVTPEFWISLAIISGSLLISSGPVSLFRYLRANVKRKQEAAIAAYQAQRDAASVPQEGVWPPPPEYNA